MQVRLFIGDRRGPMTNNGLPRWITNIVLNFLKLMTSCFRGRQKHQILRRPWKGTTNKHESRKRELFGKKYGWIKKTWTFAGISFWAGEEPWPGMWTGGQIWCHSSYSLAPNHEQDHLKGIHVYIALLFSPVPFTGCLRAYRFRFTSLKKTWNPHLLIRASAGEWERSDRKRKL